MHNITIAAIALNQTPLDWDHNRDNILAALAVAKRQGAHIVCFPELSVTGYGCEDAFLSVDNCHIAYTVVKEIMKETQGMIVAVGLPVLYRDGLYNTSCLLVDGKIAGIVAKQHLPGYGVYYEPRWFRPWLSGEATEFEICGESYPLGDLIFSINGIRLGFEICEDAWVANRTGIGLANRGVDILLNPSASHFVFGKNLIRRRFVQEGARAFGVVYVYANLLGNEAGRIIYDGDTIIAAGEDLLAVGPRFSFQDHIVTMASVDVPALRVYRSTVVDSNIILDDHAILYCDLSCDLGGDLNCDSEKNSRIEQKLNEQRSKEAKSSERVLDSYTWEKGEDVKYQEFARAVALGLFDYLRKCKQHGFVMNLSGGADSGAIACLVYLMVELALLELGSAGLQKKLSYIPEVARLKADKITAKEWMPLLFYCLYQRTENNSEVTENSANDLALALGAPFAKLDIDKIVDAYCALIEPLIHRHLSFKTDDYALQNIQSRVRAPGTWLLANIRHAIFLCSSNRSEASVGYTTLDGDTCGGLSPIAGVDKSFLISWLKWLQVKGIEEIGPIPVLQEITKQTPTAELRPRDTQQTDEGDLMPYEWLDFIEKHFLRDKHSPMEILTIMKRKFPSVSLIDLANAIEKFFTLWARNQWKRERIAPAFHLDDQSVDPKTWCRFPILSGGFKRELKKMRESIKS